MARDPRRSTSRQPPPPLDAGALERLALRYVERFATTRGKLADYLARKLRERGPAEGVGDPRATVAALAERMATLGYVDDRGFAEARAAGLARRGYGRARVAGALRAARVGEEDAAPVLDELADRAVESALALARRRRIGPFATEAADEDRRRRQLGQMLRAGHAPALARAIVACAPGETFNPD